MTTDADANSKSNQASIAKEKASPAKRRAERAERIFALAYNSRYDGFKSLATASRPLAVLAKVFDEFLFELDADGRFLGIWSSRQPLKIGRQTDFIGRHAMEVLGEDVFLPFSEVLHRVIATHEADGIEFPVDLEDGRHWFYARVLPVGRTLGKRPSVSLLAHDITAQKETEDELRKSQALLAQAEQLVNMGSWEVDASLGTVLCSDNLYRILGVDHRKCENDRPNIAQNVPPDDVVEAQKRLQAAIIEGTPFEHDFRCISAAGLRHFHALGFPLRDSEGRVVRVVGVTEDVTDRLNVEERLRRVSDQLLTLRDEEHRRMARDLHETVSQEMAALKMTLARVGDTLPKRNTVGRKFLQSARDFADAVIRQVRTVSYLLHPLLLEEAGLGSALRWYASGFAERSGIQVKVNSKGDFGRLPKETEIALFRVVQEALTNIHRHSKSPVAVIRLQRAGGKIRIAVKDAGVGMAQPSAATGWNSPLGIGIAGMRERVKQLGGMFEIKSRPGRGTTLSVEFPVTENQGPAAEKQEKPPRFEDSPSPGKAAKAAKAGS
jgi:two-component system NarL family sensor kinase